MGNESKPANEKRGSVASKSDSLLSTNVEINNVLKTHSNSIESKSISISNIEIKKAKQLLIKDLPIQTTLQSQLHQQRINDCTPFNEKSSRKYQILSNNTTR